ncbi:ribonuclease III [Rhodobacteraceae bacterium 2CG4]|uniref:Ribonuclease 3 n=1 Tax=Halovulum marinum TaxID=2662447 RepID=A0A6L5YW77_9RHOB|nr:ribonuclease III [Halovulum marinum]MSU88169.1 ribonuclease III [Halovulum marinum]
MKLNPAQAAFATRLGHDFTDPRLLVEALTHASLSGPVRRDNQRLEFLGDRILGLVIAEALLAADTNAREGALAPRFNNLVRREALAEVAEAIQLGDALMMGKSERATGGRRKQALLADAMEAVIAAVYLDAGFEHTRALVLRLWHDRIARADEHGTDAKTALQEWAQARGMAPPDYIEEARAGPDHAPVFTIAATLASGERATATANSKRAAQQAAAAMLLERLESTDDR